MNVLSNIKSMTHLTDKQKAILQATLELVAEHGLTGITMSQIAKRSKASPGIIYHYFASKDEIITTLFTKIEAEYMQALMVNQPIHQLPLEAMKEVWLKTFDYFVGHPQELVFYEQFKNSAYHDEQSQHHAEETMALLVQTVMAYIQQGLIQDWPLNAIYAMTIGVAIQLAKFQSTGQINLERALLEAIAEACCRSIQI